MEEHKDVSEDEKEDEIEIDFSGLFGKKHKKEEKKEEKKHEEHKEKHEKKHETEEKNEDKEDKEDEEDSNVSMDGIKNFFSNKKFFNEKLLAIMLLLIVIGLTIYVRALPASMPTTDDWARNSVYNYYKNGISQNINSQYPNLPDANKQTLINTQFDKFLAQNKAQVEDQIKQTSQYFKAGFQFEENGKKYTLLGDIDSYYFLRYARNYLEKGTVCDVIENGKCYDTYSMAPAKIGAGMNAHIWLIINFYKFIHFIGINIPLMTSDFYVPMFLAVLTAIFAFFAGRRIGGNIAGIFSAVLVSFNPIFLSRSLGSDTDAWNVFFPTLIVWLFLEVLYSFGQEHRWKTFRIGKIEIGLKTIILSFLLGISIGLFSYAWTGWWFMAYLVVGVLGAGIVFYLIKHFVTGKKYAGKIYHSVYSFIFIFVGLFIAVSLVYFSVSQGLATLSVISPLQTLTWFSGTKAATLGTNLWPNVLTTVAEFNEASISSIIGQLGGKLIFFIALMGIIFTLVKKDETKLKDWIFIGISALISMYLISNSAMSIRPLVYFAILLVPVGLGVLMILMNARKESKNEKEIDIWIAILLIAWFIGTMYASLKGSRFILLIVPAFAIAIASAAGFLYHVLVKLATKDLHINRIVSKMIVVILLFLLLIAPVKFGYNTARGYMPSMTTVWYDSLINIKNNSKPDAIINSWWDFGHWFKFVADRGVTLDGGTQGYPPLHWLGKTLVTDNEKEATGVLRMLDCGSNKAFDTLNDVINDTSVSVNILDKIVTLGKDDAFNYLKDNSLSDEQANNVLQYTHCNAPEDFFITSEDMIGKAGVWAHFGLWDFNRAELISVVKKMNNKEKEIEYMLNQKDYNFTREQAEAVYNEINNLQSENDENAWISPWPGYITGSFTSCINDSKAAVCTYNIKIGVNGNQNVILEKVLVNLTDIYQSKALLGFYDVSSNLKLGQNVVNVAEIDIAKKDKIERYKMNDSVFSYAILLDQTDSGYRSLIMDPNLIESTFTKLFFLDGRYMENYYMKFSDKTDITGARIIVWKINWDGTGDILNKGNEINQTQI